MIDHSSDNIGDITKWSDSPCFRRLRNDVRKSSEVDMVFNMCEPVMFLRFVFIVDYMFLWIKSFQDIYYLCSIEYYGYVLRQTSDSILVLIIIYHNLYALQDGVIVNVINFSFFLLE